jgi:hypothetical protein
MVPIKGTRMPRREHVRISRHTGKTRSPERVERAHDSIGAAGPSLGTRTPNREQ